MGEAVAVNLDAHREFVLGPCLFRRLEVGDADADRLPVFADDDGKDRHLGPVGPVAQLFERLRRTLGAAPVTEDDDPLDHVVGFAVEDLPERIAEVGAAHQLLDRFLALEEFQLVFLR